MNPTVLLILDGLGHDSKAVESPWQLAKKSYFIEIEKYFPFTTIQASGLAVGLPWNVEGNSEVGHLTMGAGRIIYNHLPRIIMAIHDKSFAENEAFVKAIKHVKKNNSKLHIMGLFSSGSVHAYIDHFYALLDITKKYNVNQTYLHLFTDGRDCAQHEGANFIKQLEERLHKNHKNVTIASVIGRHLAMDRDNNWDRTEKTYNLLVNGVGNEFEYASLYMNESYKKGVTDEFIEPALLKNNQNSRVQNGDAVIFFNYRKDSAKALTSAFVSTEFNHFKRNKVADLCFVTMTEYDKNFPVLVAFPALEIKYPLSKVVSLARLKQLHIAETEKYAHITYFFNGGIEKPFENENWKIIPSLKTSRYDLVPEMSAGKITRSIIDGLNTYDFIAANFANADMVGHTGNFDACIKAIDILSECVKEVVEAVLKKNGTVIITADHGNIEEKMYKMTGEKRTKHTTNPVPFYLIGDKWKRKSPLDFNEITKRYREVNGMLSDVAPTILEVLNIKKPEEMTGSSLISVLK